MMGWDDRARPLYETLVAHQIEWTIDDGFLSPDQLAKTGALA